MALSNRVRKLVVSEVKRVTIGSNDGPSCALCGGFFCNDHLDCEEGRVDV
jgi:hypothetical protein